jgi:hypothetical protein
LEASNVVVAFILGEVIEVVNLAAAFTVKLPLSQLKSPDVDVILNALSSSFTILLPAVALNLVIPAISKLVLNPVIFAILVNLDPIPSMPDACSRLFIVTP